MIYKLFQIQAAFFCGLNKFVIEAEVYQVVVEVWAHKKFGRQVADNFRFFFQQRLHRIDEKVLHPVSEGVRHCEIVVIQTSTSGSGALLVEKVVGKGSFKFVYAFLTVVTFVV